MLLAGDGYAREAGTLSTIEHPIHAPLPVPGPFEAKTTVDSALDSVFGARPAGISAAWRKLLVQAEMAAPHVQIASIEGEQGSGKQTLARYLLARSPLRHLGFQREDARQWLLGEIDPAGLSGFVYLDRVDLLTGPGQTLLLNVLKGIPDKAPRRMLLVASSHAPLRQMAAQGQFIPDLAFRLTACRFAVPPLRMRKEDIAPVAQALLERLCARYQQRPVSLGPGTLARLLLHSWPGNVRELASVLEAAMLESSNDTILPGDLSLPTGREMMPEAVAETPAVSLTLDEVIRRHVQYVLDINRGNKLRAARQLGISRSTLYRLLESEQMMEKQGIGM